MKISIEQANKLLAALQVDAAVAEDEHEADAGIDTDTLVKQVNQTIAASLRPVIEAQLKPEFESNFMGRYSGTLRAAVTRIFNIPKKDIDDLTVEQVVAKCKAVAETLPQAEAERLAMLEVAVHGYEQQLEELKTGYEQRLDAERQKQLQKDITARCLSLIERLPRKGGDLYEQAEMLRHKMQMVYDVHYNEGTKALEFYKDNQPAVQDNNQLVSDEDFARMWAAKAGILVNDTRHILPADIKAGQQGTYGSGVIHTGDIQANDAMDAIVAWAG